MIIGRQKEKAKLNSIYESTESEFVALYGRRRVGKTYLIKTLFNKKQCTYFQLNGEKKGSLPQQLSNFSHTITEVFYDKHIALEAPKTWHAALQQLTSILKEKAMHQKIVLFFDELPWLASPKSNFLSALDYFWNRFWVDMPNLKLIVCGSAASWMIKNIIRNKGGLHNRLTARIRLEPFNLKETKQFLETKYATISNDQLLQVYSIMGGIPYYLKQLEPGISIKQNIDKLIFSDDGSLFNEFEELFTSLFTSANAYEEIVSVLCQSPKGLSRQALLSKLKLSADGGNFDQKLQALIEAGFVMEFGAYSNTRKQANYRIIDEYSHFYLKWVLPQKKTIKRLTTLSEHWRTATQASSYNAWKGNLFETICYKHLLPICKAANIKQIKAVGDWSFIPTNKSKQLGTQIDLVFDRNDDAISICEIKCTNKSFSITKKYAADLRNKLKIFREQTQTTKQIIFIFISVNGLKENAYSKELVNWDIDLNDIIKHCS